MKAITTVWDGYRFRSRLEARWAVFFKALGVAYEYEPEGYDLDGTWYLPDFYVPRWDAFVEIKPRPEAVDETVTQTCAKLAMASHKRVLIGIGIPGSEYVPVLDSIDGECLVGYSQFGECKQCGALCVWWDVCCPFDPKPGWWQFALDRATCDHKGGVVLGERAPTLERALAAAKQARFEHGEKPGQDRPVGVLPLGYDASGRLVYVPPKTPAEIEAEKAEARRAIAIKRPWSGEQPMGILARIGQFGRASLGEDGRVIVDAPSAALTDDFKAAVRRHKPALAELLRRYGGEWPMKQQEHTPELLGALDEAAG